MSLDRINSGNGPMVDMMNVVLLVRLRLPWVDATGTVPANPLAPL